MTMLTLHVTPTDDLIEHSNTEDCVCSPTSKPVTGDTEENVLGVIIVHNSADNREASPS